LTSSLRGVRPLVELDGRPVGSGRPGRVTRAVADEVARERAEIARLVLRLDSRAKDREI
jgi:branched-subunit amino acid aminotransferase/4-amino-4-deoxychorismate lyase